MKTICVNLRVPDYEKVSKFCKATGKGKREVINRAIAWQFDHLDACLSYVSATRRTANIRMTDDEETDLNSLAEFIKCTPAQAALIATRNFILANELGEDDYMANVPQTEIKYSMIITLERAVVDLMKATDGSMSFKAQNAIRLCQSAKTLPDIPRRGTHPERRAIPVTLPDQRDRDLLAALVERYQDSPGRLIARCLTMVYLYDFNPDQGIF